MASDPAINALNSLLRRATIEDHTEALRLADAAIKAAKSSSQADALTARHTKIVALLKLDRFDDALRVLAEGGAELERRCAVEKAYALYKTGELDDAAKLCDGGKGGGRALKHVAAQIAYRSEEFETAAELYGGLTSEDAGKAAEETDLRVNVLATTAQLEWAGKGSSVTEKNKQSAREDLEAFETAYNAACGCLGRGDYAKGSILLKRARDLCEASEYLSEEDKKAEVLPIVIQQIYTFTQLGKLDEAAALQKSVVPSEVSDGSTKAIAQNNSLTAQSQKNPYIAQRLAENISSPAGSDALFDYQARAVRRNKYIIELQCQKFPGVSARTAKLLNDKTSTGSSTSPEAVSLGTLHAAAKTHVRTGKEALKTILPLLESRPHDVGLLLTIIQLYVQIRNPGPAVDLLEAFFKRLETATTPDHADARFSPGLVALAVSLYKLQGRQTAIHTELAKAAAYWQERPGKEATSLLREAGIELLHSTKPSDLAIAGDAFSRLCADSNTTADRAAVAGLVASFATTDYPKVEPHLSTLTPTPQLTKGIDAAALLSSGVAALPAAAAALTSKKRAAADAAPEAGRKKRRRRLPKDYDPNRKVDPERWLPLRDRSSYRPKGKKGKKRAAEATQGGVPVKDEETLELAGGAGSVRVEKASQGGGGGGKKKKKGKK